LSNALPRWSPSIPHTLNELELVHLALDQSVVLGKRESCHHCCFVSFHPSNKALELANLAGSHTFEPGVEVNGLIDQQVGSAFGTPKRAGELQAHGERLDG
jgi:hypothetical protein